MSSVAQIWRGESHSIDSVVAYTAFNGHHPSLDEHPLGGSTSPKRRRRAAA
jgi:hypothetical protein